MAIDAQNVGSNARQINIIGDPSTASNMASVLPVADGTSLAGKFAQIVAAAGFLLDAGGNFDVAKSSVGITGVAAVSHESLKPTYSVCSTGFTPAATATDFWTLYGSGTKTVRLIRIKIFGFATALANVDISLIRRSAVNTSGTSFAPTILTNDTNNTAVSATVALYSVNPTPGTTVGTVEAGKLNLGSAGLTGNLTFEFGLRNDQQCVLRGTTQGFALNWGGAAVPSGTSLIICAEWTEDAS